MKLKNILILSAIAGVAIWEIQIRPNLPWWVRVVTPLSNEIATECSAVLTQVDWIKIEQNPPQSLDDLKNLIGEGCPGALGSATWELMGYLLKASTLEDGSLQIEWEKKGAIDG